MKAEEGCHMQSNQSKNNQMKKNVGEDDSIREMLPYLLYAAIPLAITFLIAFTMGSTQQ